MAVIGNQMQIIKKVIGKSIKKVIGKKVSKKMSYKRGGNFVRELNSHDGVTCIEKSSGTDSFEDPDDESQGNEGCTGWYMVEDAKSTMIHFSKYHGIL